MSRLLFIGDVVGDIGMHIARDLIPKMIRDYHCDFCIVNGENADMGKGINKKQAEKLLMAGADVITGGNHSFQRNGSDVLNQPDLKTLRPANYPDGNPGRGFLEIEKKGRALLVINLQGRSFLPAIDCPFQTMDSLLRQFKKQYKCIIVDFHAEASAEKLAFAWNFDGKISAVLGTHTHVQTADARVLPLGTAYISDVGMTGAADGVIGMDADTAIKRFRTQQLKYFKLAHRNPKISAVFVDLDDNTGKSKNITAVYIGRDDYDAKKLIA